MAEKTSVVAVEGLTLRDWIAVQVLAARVGNIGTSADTNPQDARGGEWARWAYQVADDMLQVRAEQAEARRQQEDAQAVKDSAATTKALTDAFGR